jgi:hypothetical protein
MVRGMNKVKAAALAVVAVAGLTQAAGAADKAAYMQETDKGRKPMMAAADRTGFGQMLDDIGIDISGHAEVSYSYNFRRPEGDVNVGHVFDDQHDEFYLNQIDVTVARSLTADDNAVSGYSDKVNVGFKMEWIYGQDARLIHSNGLFDHYVDDEARNEEFDLNQAYVEVGVPVGNGLLFTAGKFVTPIGYELINPTLNPLYSHSYLFGFAIPFTHTGVLAKYSFDENFSLTGGVVRGWEQSLEDNNQDPSYLVSAAYNWAPGSGGEPINFIVTGITGPEQTDDVDSWRTLIDVIVSTKVSDQLTLGLNGDWGYEEEAELTDEGVATGKQAQWYGVAAYAKYDVSDMFAINARGEWFNDKDNSRGLGTNVYEATVGVTIKPFANHEIGSNLVFRPEIRYDYAQEGIFDGQNDQITVAADVIFTF